MIRPRIVRDRDVLGGKPIIEGTRIRSAMVRSYDYDIWAIRDEYPHLTYAQINAAIAFERHWSRRLQRWLAARTRALGYRVEKQSAPLRYRVAAWLIGTNEATLREDAG